MKGLTYSGSGPARLAGVRLRLGSRLLGGRGRLLGGGSGFLRRGSLGCALGLGRFLFDGLGLLRLLGGGARLLELHRARLACKVSVPSCLRCVEAKARRNRMSEGAS